MVERTQKEPDAVAAAAIDIEQLSK